MESRAYHRLQCIIIAQLLVACKDFLQTESTFFFPDAPSFDAKENAVNPRYCFFDLDGTLTDSSEGITRSVAYALEKSGIQPPPVEELFCFIGPPLVRAFSEFYGMDEAAARQAVVYYREYYPQKGIYECRVYDGIRRLLEELNRAGVVCVLATCKPHVFANRILEHFDLAKYFSFVSGPEFDGTRNEKSEVIAYALEQLKIRDPRAVWMIGDRRDDILGAHANGIEAIGAAWGFGSREELEAAGAAFLCESADELLAHLLPKAKKM